MNYKTRQPFPHAAYVEGQRNFTYFDRSLTSGMTDVVIESPGDFLYIDQASTGVVSVELNMRQGGTLAPILLAAGGSIECDFASIKLNATAQLNKSVRVIVGNGARIKGGATVNATSELITTVPGQKAISNNGKAFMTYTGKGASVGNFSQVSVHNPSTSSTTCYVTAICPLTVNMTIAATNSILVDAPGSIPNIKAGGASANAVIRTEANASFLSSYQYGVIFANSYFRPDRPFCLPPGTSLLMGPQSTNTAATVTIELFEE